MKTAYFDCFSGISGDMIIGALLDAGLSFKSLKAELEKLDLPGYTLSRRKVTRGGISGVKFSVKVKDDKTSRGLCDILKIIEKSGLEEEIKDKARLIFSDMARVEAKIHDEPLNSVHFHELGGIDCMVDIAGALCGLKLLGIEKVFSSAVNTGSGFVNTSHGRLPVPCPASLGLLEGVPVYSSGVRSELATPTGCAIIRRAASSFGDMPLMKVETAGYGAGDKELSSPNLLRVVTGESGELAGEEGVILVETNIDNMNPEFYGHVFKLLEREGALDVFMTPVFMKKQRPGTKLSVLCGENFLEAVSRIIFRQTSSIGIRYSRVSRKTLRRSIEPVDTRYGKVNVKFAYSGKELLNVSPEYDDCALLAEKLDVPVKEIYYSAKKGAEMWLKK